MEMNILIGGEAGQGLVTVGDLLSKVLVREGFYIIVEQSYQSRIRGGHNTYAIRFSDSEIHSSKEKYDLLVSFNKETIDLHSKDLNKNAIVISDNSFCANSEFSVCVPFKDLADKKFENTVFLGIIGYILGFNEDVILKTINDYFSKKSDEIVDENKSALEKSYSWAKNNVNAKLLELFKLNSKTNKETNRLMLNGNQAIALGAISAGLRFYSYYPMTPSTSIAQTIISHANDMNIIVEQAEDEISVINMAIGASFTGAISMVGTSGGGFALMVEGVSLSAMTETPIVIAVAGRPSPATGLPTRTEQGDLEFVLHSGHGEFARAIFAPSTIEECFHLTRKAFFLAEKYQTPVFILTDQYLADSYRAVLPFDIEKLSQVKVGAEENQVKIPYNRYEITKDGISPRLLPSATKNLVIADSDEHTKDGHLTEDLNVRIQMVDKRLAKIEGLKKEIEAPKYFGEKNPDILFVSFGSTFGAVYEAVDEFNSTGRKTAGLCFSEVWPMVPDKFINYLKDAKKVICVEGNATGQFARLIKRECGFEINEKILRYDGLAITSEYILRKING